jgi:predicted HTH domain antitoxin
MLGLMIPDHIIEQSNMTPSELLLEFAVFLYQREKLTLAQAARLSKLSRIDFQKALAARKIPLNFGVEDLKQELETIEQVKHDYRQRHLPDQ